jgi:hypothetical protein
MTLIRVIIAVFLIFPMACNESRHGDSSFNKASVKLPSANQLAPLLREGDIILRQGRGPFSSEIVRVMHEKNPVSHCGIIIRHNDSLVVMQSISKELSGIDGIQLQSLQGFINDTADSNLFIMRCTDTVLATGIGREALALVDKNIPFDHEYNLRDTRKMYCAELPYYCFNKLTQKKIFKYLKTNGPALIRFDSFFQSKWFTPVYCCRKIEWIK